MTKRKKDREMKKERKKNQRIIIKKRTRKKKGVDIWQVKRDFGSFRYVKRIL